MNGVDLDGGDGNGGQVLFRHTQFRFGAPPGVAAAWQAGATPLRVMPQYRG
jgi:hypothetical protein